jgi:dihydrofolate reductase
MIDRQVGDGMSRGGRTMAKIVVSEFLTLDGVMQGPGSADEDRSGGFDQGGWQLPYFDDAFGKFVLDGFERMEGLLLGRVTYEIFAAYWPTAPADDPVGKSMNAYPKYVASTSLSEPLSWENSTLLGSDVPGAVAKLREGPGTGIQVIGSGQLVQTLIKHGLVDEYRLMIHPLVLGQGKRLFRDGTADTKLKLVDSIPTSSGVMLATYVPA